MVCSRAEIAEPGGFVTTDLLGVPVIVRNFDGELHAFRNVCSHRNCLINSRRRGRLKTFKCQYHGWEYKANGTTAHIPDGECFRPMDRAKARLQTFKVATCGDLVFVSLAEDPPPLRDFIGARFDRIAARFQRASRYVMTRDYDFRSNWKIVIENTLEGYHIPEIHSKSFLGIYPGESHITHSLDDLWTMLEYDTSEFPRISGFMAMGVKILGAERTNLYTHHHIHPGLVIVTLDLQSYAFAYEPVTERSSKLRLVAYSYRGNRQNPLAQVAWWISRLLGRFQVQQLVKEDASLFEAVQTGIEASHQPGCIGTLEERLYSFQKYVLDRCEPAQGEALKSDEGGTGLPARGSTALSPGPHSSEH